MVKHLLKLLAVAITLAFPGVARAVPILQVYVEGATYDTAGETWVLSGSGTFRLWVIGNIQGSGGQGPIYDVRLAASYNSAASGVSISLAPTRAGGTGAYGGVLDPSTPQEAVWIRTVTDGSRPALGDGSLLPSHGTYGVGRTWQEFRLGDLTLTDSSTGDFIDAFPTSFPGRGQINVYNVTVTGTEPDGGGASVHFDVYDHVLSKNKARYVFAPFSHDGEGGGEPPPPPPPPPPEVPEPSMLALAGLGALGFLRASRRAAARG